VRGAVVREDASRWNLAGDEPADVPDGCHRWVSFAHVPLFQSKEDRARRTYLPLDERRLIWDKSQGQSQRRGDDSHRDGLQPLL
jgi:hypothetical protein